MHFRESITSAYRLSGMAFSSKLSNLYERLVHGRIPGDLVQGGLQKGRIRSAPVVSALQPLRSLAEAMQHKDAVRPNFLRHPHLQARRPPLLATSTRSPSATPADRAE